MKNKKLITIKEFTNDKLKLKLEINIIKNLIKELKEKLEKKQNDYLYGH